MNRSFIWSFALTWMVLASNFGWSQQDSSTRQAADRAVNQLVGKQKYDLKYRFKVGEEVRWNVEHTASTKTQIAGKNESTASRTQSTKLWKISNVDSLGNITFVHSVESTALWQKIGEGEPLSYDSKKDQEVPDEFLPASEMVGKPLAVVTISSKGKIIDRKVDDNKTSFGVGDICTPLPTNPVATGQRWYVPTEFEATDDNGRRLKLKARINYQLTKVIDGVAIISFRTEVLTPIESDQIRSQLLQKLNDGYVAFDIEMGRLTTKEVEWNEKVQEYAGADSFLQYTGKMIEKIVVSVPRGDQDRISKSGLAPKIKRPGDKPIIRK